MKASEMLRLVFININQNKFKTIMTSIGIVVGAATIVLVIAIGRGGQKDVAEQFNSLNAGAIDVSYEYEGADTGTGGGGFSFGDFFGNFGNFPGFRRSGSSSDGGSRGSGRSSRDGSSSGSGQGGGMPGGFGGFGSGQGDGMPGGFSPSGDGGGMSGGFSRPGSGSGSSEGGSSSGRGSRPEGGSSEGRDGSSSGGFSRPEGFNMPEGGNGFTPGRENTAGGNNDGDAEKGSGESVSAGEEETEAADLTDDRMNQEEITLTEDDVDDILMFVNGISGATISYTTRADVEGANLTQAQSYTIAGVKEGYFPLSNLDFAAGESFTETDDGSSERVCVLGSSRAKELFGSADKALGEKLYLADRAYTIVGVLESSQTVSAGISPDEVIFVPYSTGIKYIAGSSANPVITVVTDDVNLVSQVEEEVQAVLSTTYDNANFTFSDAGSKMQAAESSNRILTMLLAAMAAIVFLVGGIGIMNVLFVSVKERTAEIGVLKALGASRKMILGEFLTESAAISLIGGLLGVGISFLIIPLAEHYGMRTEMSMEGCLAALGFAVLTGTIFGFYPAWKASRLVPVDALNAE